MLRLPGLIVIASCLAASGQAQAAGFDCKRAHTAVEKQICADPKLSALDDELVRLAQEVEGETRGVNGETGEISDPFGKEQTHWRETVRDRCGDAACVEKAYVARIGQIRKDWASALGAQQ